MKASLRMIFITDMVDSFILMEIITSGIGLTGSGLVMVDSLINQAGYMKDSGRIVKCTVRVYTHGVMEEVIKGNT